MNIVLERAKIVLSTAENAEVALAWRRGPVKFTLTRRELEKAVEPVVERCRGPIRVALEEAELKPAEI